MRFRQIHAIVAYPPANLNRDDNNRPKTAVLGGHTRHRISSQAMKRAWRTSDVFASHYEDRPSGVRTAKLGEDIYSHALEAGASEEAAAEISKAIRNAFGAEGEGLKTKQMPFFDAGELEAARKLAVLCAQEGREPGDKEIKRLYSRVCEAFDVAAFGRMLARTPAFNIEAAIQVAHPVSINRAVIEDDYFTAVDDWSRSGDDATKGAQHVGENSFSASAFYMNVVIDRDLLASNLNGNDDTLEVGLRALAHSVLTVSPKGMQAPFASRARAVYALAEKGNQAPRSLINAFYDPVRGDHLQDAVKRLEKSMIAMDKAYESCADMRLQLPDMVGLDESFRTRNAGLLKESEGVVIPKEGSITEFADFIAR